MDWERWPGVVYVCFLKFESVERIDKGLAPVVLPVNCGTELLLEDVVCGERIDLKNKKNSPLIDTYIPKRAKSNKEHHTIYNVTYRPNLTR